MHISSHAHHRKGPRLGLWYRLCWRVSYTVLSLYGPAELGAEQDPRRAMRRERQARALQPGRVRAVEGPA